MAITKKSVESAIATMDDIVKGICNEVGLFDYDLTSLVSDWKNARRSIAQCAAKVISGDAKISKKKKDVIRSYGGSPVNEDGAKDKNAIALGKSKAKQPQLYIKVEK